MRTYICALIIFFLFIGISNLRNIREGLEPCLDASASILFNQNATLLDSVQSQVDDFMSKVTAAENAVTANTKKENDNWTKNNDIMTAICPHKCIELEKHWSEEEQEMKCQASCCTYWNSGAWSTKSNTCTNPWKPTHGSAPQQTVTSTPAGYRDPNYKAPPPSEKAKSGI